MGQYERMLNILQSISNFDSNFDQSFQSIFMQLL